MRKGRTFCERVVAGAQRLDRLIEDVLTLSRVQRTVEPAEDVDSGEIVADVLRHLEPRIRETQAVVKVADGLPAIRADRRWATQAVQNLVSNALKYTAEGEAPQVEIGGFKGPEGVGLVVRDRGMGVPPECADRIFQLFQRAVSRNIEGTGAGLAIVKRVAERHGGTGLGPSSRRGAVRSSSSRSDRALGMTHESGRRTAGDSRRRRQRRRRAAFARVAAQSAGGESAARGARRRRGDGLSPPRGTDTPAFPGPGLVLLDINMPKKNGFEVLAEMKSDPLLRIIPVVMLTTSNREADVDDGLQRRRLFIRDQAGQFRPSQTDGRAFRLLLDDGRPGPADRPTIAAEQNLRSPHSPELKSWQTHSTRNRSRFYWSTTTTTTWSCSKNRSRIHGS